MTQKRKFFTAPGEGRTQITMDWLSQCYQRNPRTFRDVAEALSIPFNELRAQVESGLYVDDEKFWDIETRLFLSDRP
jgi:hypothetical protein